MFSIGASWVISFDNNYQIDRADHLQRVAEWLPD